MLRPREPIYSLYWEFAAERQQIFLRRFHGLDPPWTENPILKIYKFCNTYRASDRVSQYLIRKVIYSSDYSAEDTIFRIIFFRLFSKPTTWCQLKKTLGDIVLNTFDLALIDDALSRLQNQGITIYTGAFILPPANQYGYTTKHRNHLELLCQMFKKDHLADRILKVKNFKTVYDLLLQYPSIGPFLAYQLAVDLNYSDVIDFSENDFTVAGPGAVRGIRKCFSSTSSLSTEEIIQWMVKHQDQEFKQRGIQFPGLFGRPLHAIDCQGLFCEVDKYTRVAFPDLKSNRVRIKKVFRPSLRSLNYYYPPKWGLTIR